MERRWPKLQQTGHTYEHTYTYTYIHTFSAGHEEAFKRAGLNYDDYPVDVYKGLPWFSFDPAVTHVKQQNQKVFAPKEYSKPYTMKVSPPQPCLECVCGTFVCTKKGFVPRSTPNHTQRSHACRALRRTHDIWVYNTHIPNIYTHT
jgi:hypothetical protein